MTAGKREEATYHSRGLSPQISTLDKIAGMQDHVKAFA
jgi:hypothetical protein